MKQIVRCWYSRICFVCLAMLISSCQDYLDKADEASISDADIFGKFFAYQGFVEDMYQFVVDITTRDQHGKSNWNWGDDITGCDPDRMGSFTDDGYYWKATWDGYVSPFTFDYKTAWGEDGGANHRPERNFWGHGWYGIRRANIALSRIDELVEPYFPQGIDVERSELLKEQKDLIRGQAYFFRAYFHWEIIRAWGGMPYIQRVISPNDVMQDARLTYQQSALKVAADLHSAEKYLPNDWDETYTGQITKGGNRNRLTRGAAIALNGKNYLYAASPLMNGTADPSIPGSGVYDYNLALCDSAAKEFAKVFELEREGYYELVPVPFSETPTEWSIQDTEGNTKYLDCSEFSKAFYTFQTQDVPSNAEIIFTNTCNGNTMWDMGVHYMKEFGGFNSHGSPSANYVEYFGMADGTRFKVHPEDPSTWDLYDGDCWNRRDPRFYYNIVKDGDKMSNFDKGQSMVPPRTGMNYAQLYSIPYLDPVTGVSSIGRDFSAGASCTGYSWKKFYPYLRNIWDVGFESLYTLTCPKIRLADVYLMYAEAVNEVYGPHGKPSYCDMSAVEAVNKVRARFHVPGVPAEDIQDKETFRETIRRERAVELAFENHRWYDIRRWYVLGDPQYANRYKLTFDHDHTIFRREISCQLPFETKLYWMPIRIADVNLYEGFAQNPGW